MNQKDYFTMNYIPKTEKRPKQTLINFQQKHIGSYPCLDGDNVKLTSLFDYLSLSPDEFVKKANSMFNEFKIKIPKKYPKTCIINDSLIRKFTGQNPFLIPWKEFILCVYNCIILKEEYNMDVKKVIKKELIGNNSRAGILHANSLSGIALHYLKKECDISIPNEQKGKKNPDLIINNIKCEIKCVDSSDWTKEVLNNNENHFLRTGEGPKHELAEDICFDIGKFIEKEKSGFKGIKQGDVIFADLTQKWSLMKWMLITLEHKTKFSLPNIKKFRIIFFTRDNIDFSGFYVDFDPRLWKLIRNTKTIYGIHIPPPLSVKEEKWETKEPHIL